MGLVWVVARGELRGEQVALKTKVLEKNRQINIVFKARQQLVTASAGGGI